LPIYWRVTDPDVEPSGESIEALAEVVIDHQRHSIE
jgi:hypothetical protein